LKNKIAIIHKGGSSHTWCEDLLAGFLQIGCEATVIALRDRGLEERRVEAKTGHKYFENPVTIDRLAAQIRQAGPALVVLLNYAALPEEAHSRIRQAAGPGTPLVSWLADHIQQLPPRSSPNLDGVYYFDSATLPLLEHGYAGNPVRLQFLPLAVNLDRFQFNGLAWAERKPGLVFVGNNTKSRRALIEKLQELGGQVSSYGPKAQAGLQLWKRRKISPGESSRIYGSYQAVLNMLQPPNTVYGLNLRAFEVPACGGLGTYPLTPNLGLTFVPGHETIGYQSVEDLHAQLDEIFTNPARAEAMIAAGRQRVISDHTYASRAERLRSDWLP